jgi:Zn-dependent peptidase ImmA (M78 family)
VPTREQVAPKSPEQLLDELGIRYPQEIEVELIAEYCNATVVYEPLSNCEARIIGIHDRAIIAVNQHAIRPRRRFSAAHELGHWLYDRGQVALSCQERSISRSWTGSDREARANNFASDLLLPKSMFVPRARAKNITFQTVDELAELFQTSRTATAIRLVRFGSYPSMVVCSSLNRGREWFVASSEIERRLWPVKVPGAESTAFKLLRGERVRDEPVDVDADAWIDTGDAADYVVREHSRKVTADLVLSLLWWKNEKQVMALDS